MNNSLQVSDLLNALGYVPEMTYKRFNHTLYKYYIIHKSNIDLNSINASYYWFKDDDKLIIFNASSKMDAIMFKDSFEISVLERPRFPILTIFATLTFVAISIVNSILLLLVLIPLIAFALLYINEMCKIKDGRTACYKLVIETYNPV